MAATMDFPGAAPPPPGVTPNLDHPFESLRLCNYVVQACTILLVTVFVAARIYSKIKRLGGNMTWDDYACYAAWMFMVGYCITACFASVSGGGLDQWEVRKTDIQGYFKSCYAATIFYAPMALFVKLALALMIIRVFGPVYKKTAIGVYAFIIMLILYYVSGLIIKIRICWPIEAYWLGQSDKCLNQSAIVTADSIISVVSDLVILLLPTPLTWSLQLPVRERLRVIGILCAGGVATAFSVYRLGMILTEGKSANQTVVFIKVILSGNAEVGIGLICACLPAVNALVMSHFGRGSSYADRRYGSSHRTPDKGTITLTRSFHVDSVSRGPKSAARDRSYEMDSGRMDRAELVWNVQAEPRTQSAERRSVSID